MQSQDNAEKLNSVLSKVLAIDKGMISDEMNQNTISSWDSFNALMLVSQLETEFNMRFTMNEVIAMKSVRDIKATLRAHGVQVH